MALQLLLPGVTGQRERMACQEGTAAQGSGSHQEGAGGLKPRKQSGNEKCDCTELCSDSQAAKVKTVNKYN